MRLRFWIGLFLLFAWVLVGIVSTRAAVQSVDWPNVGNDKGGMRYSKLDQINRRNVKNLEVAWVYHTGDAAKGNGSTIECTVLKVGSWVP